MILISAFCIVLIHTSTAHVFSYVPRNIQHNIQQPAQNLNNFTPLANNRAAISRPLAYANYNTNNLLNANIANAQVTNAELENARFANLQIANAEIANAKFANAQLANAELANAKFANGQIANAERANLNYGNAELARFQPSWASNNNAIVNTNVENANANSLNNLGNAGFWANNNLVNLNGNMATFSLGDGPHAFTITSGSPNSPPFGIQLMADALEVGGTVSVNGMYPIYGTVAVNGNLPTDGSAAVNYSCGRPVNA
ncbi:putative uncharacterized protein DDB_G0282133 [Pieris rapae]|uniref:putative uncharacterized protein DDB_G0282133 n=1 Tax=Pieris rapae TaxID=64459 RepID=UPI001E280BB8|nr:putative uncharacterized protein DDB_G0282133 [Pieris rapae]